MIPAVRTILRLRNDVRGEIAGAIASTHVVQKSGPFTKFWLGTIWN